MKRYASKSALAIDIIYGLYCLYLIFFRTADIQGNLEASAVWAYPMAVSHMAIHKKLNRENNKNDN
jgi:hypothetical protein